VGQDLHKGKLTLPIIHHLGACPPRDRGRALLLLEAASSGPPDARAAAEELLALLQGTGSIEHARTTAADLVAGAKRQLESLPDTPPRALLFAMADAVITRSF